MEFSQQLAAGQARIEEALAACVQRFPAHGQLKEAIACFPGESASALCWFWRSAACLAVRWNRRFPLPVLWKWSIPIP